MVERRRQARRLVLRAGFLIGAGSAALTHGILFRQILGWHHVVDAADVRVAEMSDGFVAAGALVLLLWGVVQLVKARGRLNTPRVPRRLLGAGLLGAGAFQVAEGLTMHHVLGLHRVNPSGNALAWDILYLLVGLTMAAVGALVLQRVAHEVRRLEQGPPPREHHRRTGLAR